MDPVSSMLEPMSSEFRTQIVSGWGNSSPSACSMATVTSEEVLDVLRSSLTSIKEGRGVSLRGLGRAYGDAAQNGGGRVLRMEDDLSGVLLDEVASVVRTPAGVSLNDLLTFLVPKGFFVPVTPGTRFVTVGGAVASDIHGKNHHVDGSFGSHVQEMKLLLANGEIVDISPQKDPSLFWATIGGMGLTGVILEVCFRVPRIETSRCTVSTRKFDNLDTLLAAMAQDDESFKYSVAWIDLLATGRRTGRGILWRGEHSTRDELTSHGSDPLVYETKKVGSVPPVIPAPGLVNRLTSRVFNEFWYRMAPGSMSSEIKSIPAYFHPLDAVGHWNRLYGPNGFLQYQFVVPFDAESTLREVVELISRAGVATPLVVLKRFGEGNPGMLSFPFSGWTLTVDIASRIAGLSSLLHRLDEMVVGAGGRHYLAKDSHMNPRIFRAGYPRFEEWSKVKERVDPSGIFTSDLARRLDMVK